MIITGSLPVGATRRMILWSFAPLAVVEISHLVSAVTGVALMYLARGLIRAPRQRLDERLGAAGARHRPHGAARRRCAARSVRRLLPRRGSAQPGRLPAQGALFDQEFSLIQVGAIATVLALATWIGFFAFRAVAL